MPVAIIWAVPGFLGSELFSVSKPGRGPRSETKVWPLLRQAFVPELLRYLKWPSWSLDYDILPGNVIQYGYAPWVTRMRETFLPLGIDVRPFTYDWRAPIMDSAADLKQLIYNTKVREGVTDHRILAHSMGGNIACMAWKLLKDLGLEGLIKRLVTVCAPLDGTYMPCVTWRLEAALLNLIGNYGQLADYLVRGIFASNLSGLQRQTSIGQLFNTWPGTYDLLPGPGSTSDPADAKGRALCYDATKWATSLAPPDAALLSASLADYHAKMTALWGTIPDPVIAHVVGSNHLTPVRLDDALYSSFLEIPFEVGGSAAAANFDRRRMTRVRLTLPRVIESHLGDGVVPTPSQAFPNRQVFALDADHGDILSHPWLLANIVDVMAIPPTPQGATPPVQITSPSWPAEGPQRTGPPLSTPGPLVGPPYPDVNRWNSAVFDSRPPLLPSGAPVPRPPQPSWFPD